MTAVERTTVSPDLPAPVRVLLDHVTDGVVLLDAGGRPLFLNEAARHLLSVEPAGTGGEQGVLDRALALGGRVVSLPGPGAVADAVVIPAPEVGTLAERERSAILRALEATHGRQIGRASCRERV